MHPTSKERMKKQENQMQKKEAQEKANLAVGAKLPRSHRWVLEQASELQRNWTTLWAQP